MGTTRLAAVSGTMVVILLAAVNVVGQPVGHLMPEGNVDSSIPRAPIINEIAPVGSTMQPAWIELHNPLDREIDISGLVLGFSVNTEVELTGDIPRIPPRGYLQIVLDNDGSEVTVGTTPDPSSHGGTAITVVHLPQSSTLAWQPNRGMLACYMPVDESHDQTALVDFVAWGAPARGGWTRRFLGPAWPVTGYVTLQETSGIYDPGTTIRSGESIGLLPGAESGIPGDWAVYSHDEITPGTRNPLPRPRFFTPPSGAAVKHEDLNIAWKRRLPGERYQIELSTSLDFSAGVQSFELDAPIFRSEGRIEPGKYLYRVRRFTATPENPTDASAFSEVMSIESVNTMCGDLTGVGIEMHTVLDNNDFKYQRKDTNLLCLGGCGKVQWDQPHNHYFSTSYGTDNCGTGTNQDPGQKAHGSDYCVRACIAMMVSHFGQCLSQDRIAYFSSNCSNAPEGDLAHRSGMEYPPTLCSSCDLPRGGKITEAMVWALGVDEVLGLTARLHWDSYGPQPPEFPKNAIGFSHSTSWISFELLKHWMDDGRPIMVRTTGTSNPHASVIAGYCFDSTVDVFSGRPIKPKTYIRVFDPISGPRWMKFEQREWANNTWGIWVGPAVASNTTRSDEESVWNDQDGDGAMDFDEIHRFMTLHTDNDSDDDGVGDREDFLGYVIHGGEYMIFDADWDGDDLRKEIDPDNDNDGCLDGVEDPNHDGMEDADDNGAIDPGETSSFDENDCVSPP